MFEASTKEVGGPVNLHDLARHLPGVIFQFQRDHSGHMHFPYLAGRGLELAGVEPSGLRQDARPLLARLHTQDHPHLMAAIERSARWRTPVAIKFRLQFTHHRYRWIALRAQPEDAPAGVLWHGMMIDITEQMIEEVRLRRLSDTDDLTGLANRRYLMARFDEELSRCNRHNSPLSFMLIDFDHFKRINDTWGHLYGNQVLAEFGRLCRGLLRTEDISGRFGGEEFAVILPSTPIVASRPLAEKICTAVAQHDFGIPSSRVTISIGLAEYRLGEPRDILINRADQCLYTAKHQGRNRVAC